MKDKFREEFIADLAYYYYYFNNNANYNSVVETIINNHNLNIKINMKNVKKYIKEYDNIITILVKKNVF